MAGSSQKNRRYAGNHPSDEDRKRARQNVALGRQEQKREALAKTWIKDREARLQRDIRAIEAAMKDLRQEIKARGEEATLGARFLRQIRVFVDRANGVREYISTDRRQAEEMLTAAVGYPRGAESFRGVKTINAETTMLATLEAAALVLAVLHDLVLAGKVWRKKTRKQA